MLNIYDINMYILVILETHFNYLRNYLT